MGTISNRRCARALTFGIAFCAVLMITSPFAAAAEKAKEGTESFIEKMAQWQNKMSENFRDTWKSLHGDENGKPITTASVDLREDKDSYTIRLSLPERDLEKVKVTLEEETLRIVAPAGDKVGRYEQSVALGGVDSSTEPKIERRQKDGMIVVTIHKSVTVADSKPATVPDPSLLPLTDWDRDIFARMEKMRRDMDQVFASGFRPFRTVPQHKGYFDEPRFGSTFDLKEEGDNYVVRGYLPDRSGQNINVAVEDQTLKIEANEEESTAKQGAAGALHSMRKAAYSQVLTLPRPVQSDKMKVEKQDGMVVVTLPKAK